MLFVREMPSERQLTRFYQEYSTFKGYTAHGRKVKPLSWLALVLHCSQNVYIEALERTGGIHGRSVLDFGCSTGRFMELIRFKRGSAIGVEIDACARADARALGFTVTETAPMEGQFDVTCAFQVLEHLNSPRELVEIMARLTKPEGRVLMAVPNASEVQQLGHDWLGFRIDLEHVNYFSVSTLTDMLRRSGLLVEHAWQHRQPAVTRTDMDRGSPPPGLRARAHHALQCAAETACRMLMPPPERFLEGSFVLSLLARKA